MAVQAAPAAAAAGRREEARPVRGGIDRMRAGARRRRNAAAADAAGVRFVPSRPVTARSRHQKHRSTYARHGVARCKAPSTFRLSRA